MQDIAVAEDIADYYERFAVHEAHGVSDLYEEWALGIAADAELIGRIAELPRMKRQANLIFGASRAAGAPQSGFPEFRSWLIDHWSDVRELALTRSTQTNEAGRCATLLPELASISGPIALLEVGASAGLCLYPDRYSYEFDTGDRIHRVDPTDGPSDVVLPVQVRGGIRIPDRVPDVIWRAGIDLNPLDISDSETREWLLSLIWPGQEYRRDRLQAAARIASVEPPRIVAGGVLETLVNVAADVPANATLVVFHSAVLAYLEPKARRRFAELVREIDAVWLSNEGVGILPEIAARLPKSAATDDRDFILARDGVPTAFTRPHGQGIRSLDAPPF